MWWCVEFRPGWSRYRESLEQSAINLGASKFTAFMKITLPLITANIIAASVLAFSFAMLEVSDSLILAQQESHYPITKQMYAVTFGLGCRCGVTGSGIGSCRYVDNGQCNRNSKLSAG